MRTALLRLRWKLFPPKHVHEWNNTGDWYTDERGVTLVLTKCASCGVTLIVRV